MKLIDDSDYVYAFTPRRIDGPRFVAEDRDELAELEGTQTGAEQCDGCGNNVYRIVREGTTFYAQCSLDDNPDEFTHNEPCGSKYLISLSQAGKTVF